MFPDRGLVESEGPPAGLIGRNKSERFQRFILGQVQQAD
jgi:ABC-type histidine transport system ATPase subunit